ncbi:Na(+)/H(+) exchange regulatory cofactor NHE-RF3-like isoform X2 [Boleophthalmus pectinirostris]|uniref:Na(+)/H(+) exchange regulatory cofactor NHE-RF3-like isoform X2 n=1 Tax=Boleophthalmus pectinirostris TaxID=150288 RepID=UPI00242D8718|nr:Na(+)/H(+) exchange regulatory cofactor NHE-RF3-like isoform X2 [Boleophthalmus pectinirostris]
MMGDMDKRTLTEGILDKDFTGKFTFNPKEGIDNPIMVITDDTDSGPPRPRLCVLKREQGESYGFNLRAEKGRPGHIIRSIASGGIAERSGLMDGDRLLEVNGCFVDDISHQEVSRRINVSGNQISVLVLSGDQYEQAKSEAHDLRNVAVVTKCESVKPPRLCHIKKNSTSGLGIGFTAVEGQKGHFTVNLVPGGAAEKAGVYKGDRLVWMNGGNVEDLTHSALTKMLKKSGSQVTILVVDAESEKYYNSQRLPILPAMATPHNLPFKARKFHLVQDKNGYGFILRLEKSPSGRTAHVLREMDHGGPAEKAGVRDGELLLEVNEESVMSLKHEEIVDRVRQSGQEVTITTITPKGLDFYTMLGLSPLLFCEEVKEQDSSVPATLINEEEENTCKPRFCTVQKGSLGFGFNVSSVPHMSGNFISQVVDGGPGHKAGLREGDLMLEVNGHNVEKKSLDDVIILMKEGTSLSLRVVQKLDHQQPAPEPCSSQEEGNTDEITYL